jgi:hypothetical protein
MSSFKRIRTNLSTLPRTARLSIRDWRIGRSGAGYSMAALQPLIGDRYLPWSIYSVNPDLARQICNEIVINRRENILEFGSGVMTAILVALARNLDLPLQIRSVDQNADWLETVERMVGDPGPASIELIHAPLVDYQSEIPSPAPLRWYEMAGVAVPDRSVDLAIVDGPDDIGWSRWAALPYLEPRLAERCAFVLDDIHLPGVQRVAKDWRKRLEGEFAVECQSLIEWYRRGEFWEVD